jgi:hypothetical protein
MIDKLIIEDDPDGLDWKTEHYDADGAPYPEIVLQALAFRNGNQVDSLNTIDFYARNKDWVRGEFRRVRDIPARCRHLRSIARDMGLPH